MQMENLNARPRSSIRPPARRSRAIRAMLQQGHQRSRRHRHPPGGQGHHPALLRQAGWVRKFLQVSGDLGRVRLVRRLCPALLRPVHGRQAAGRLHERRHALRAAGRSPERGGGRSATKATGAIAAVELSVAQSSAQGHRGPRASSRDVAPRESSRRPRRPRWIRTSCSRGSPPGA
jgi:hypothetical protein